MELCITKGKGLHLRFDNGITLSIQIGGGNYDDPLTLGDGADRALPPSKTAEIAIWDSGKNWADLSKEGPECSDEVSGYVPIEDVMGLIPELKALPDGASADDIRVALFDFRQTHG